MERKATDVLLDVEKKLDLLLDYYKAVDFNQKLILTRLANIEQLIANQPVSNVILPLSKPGATVEAFNNTSSSTVAKAPISPSRKVLVATQITNTSEVVLDEQGEPELLLDLKPSKRRDQRPSVGLNAPTSTVKTVPVQQKVTYPDGKNVILANVEIFDSTGQLVKKTRTNSAGKWSAVLAMGNYRVHVSKNATSEKPAVEHKVQVEIPLSEIPLELTSLQ